MSEKSLVFEEKIKHSGLFNFKSLYAMMYNWFADEKYILTETLYEEKLIGDKKELKIKWEAGKDVSDYFRNLIKVEIRIIRMKEVEVEKDGKKEKTNEGDLDIKFDGTLERDYQKSWEASPMLKFFRSIFDKYITKTTRDEYEIRLNKKVTSFVEDIKAFLALEGKR